LRAFEVYSIERLFTRTRSKICVGNYGRLCHIIVYVGYIWLSIIFAKMMHSCQETFQINYINAKTVHKEFNTYYEFSPTAPARGFTRRLQDLL